MENKKRLVDVNALLRRKRNMGGADVGGEFWDEAVLVSDIKTVNTVDAVEVVRCRDCKHIMFSDCYGECGKGHMGIVRPDDFCSRGERKEGADNG